ncbi:MAG: hypothetical protein EHM14_04785 [Methanothrix sp.]|nr:MAG: hypothetical protein EHM14_04785 [Methanothrix sp.]
MMRTIFGIRPLSSFAPLLAALAFAIFLAATAQGMPTGNQTWSEEPWDAAAQDIQAAAAPALSSPMPFNISGYEPSTILLGDSKINFSDYASQGPEPKPELKMAELWILEGDAWSRYKRSTVGDEVDLVFRMPAYGKADVYLISYANSSIEHWNLNFQEGYSLLKLTASKTGRQFIILTAKNVPSNALMIDVSAPPAALHNSPVDVMAAAPGRTKVAIVSERIRGYDVYVDGVFYSSDIADGKLDGNASFILRRDGKHTITISERDGQGNTINKNEHAKEFKMNTAYTLKIN